MSVDVLQHSVQSDSERNMCTGKCSLCISFTLFPLVLLSIFCNIVLFFPAGRVEYAKEAHITEEVKYMGGLVGGGLLVLIPALYICMAGEEDGYCSNRCGMFLSIVFAAVGVCGALYSFIVAGLGLTNGPLCHINGNWTTPFKNSNLMYLINHESWADCSEPGNVVLFNIGLFVTLLAASCVQMLLCAAQMINGLVGCVCGTCNK